MAALTPPSHWRTRSAHDKGDPDMTGTVRLLRLLVAAALTAALAIGVTAPVAAQDDVAILEEVLAYEQGLTDPWFQNDVSAWVASINGERA
jgi:hypothetical protein